MLDDGITRAPKQAVESVLVGTVPTRTLWRGLECIEHGGPAHVQIHEAGHAVLATHFGFTFERVQIYSNPFEHPVGDGFLAGGVFFVSAEERRTMTRGNPRDMLLMCIAGALAEELVFGDTLEDSSRGDVYVWRRDVGMLNPTSLAPLTEAIGSSMEDGVMAARALVAENEIAIRAVASALERASTSALSYVDVCECAFR